MSSPYLQGGNLRVSLCFVRQSEQGDAYKLSTKGFGVLPSTTRVKKVADLLVTYADSPLSIFMGYHTLLPGMSRGFERTRVAGFEPAHEGVKVLCLTTWLYPMTRAGLEPATHGLKVRCSTD